VRLDGEQARHRFFIHESAGKDIDEKAVARLLSI